MTKKPKIQNKRLVKRPVVAAGSPAELKRRGWKARGRGSRPKVFNGKSNKYNKNFTKRSWKEKNVVPRHDGRNHHFKKFEKKNFFRPFNKNYFINKEVFFENSIHLTYHFFRKDAGAYKKLAMAGYWDFFKDSTQPRFSFSYSTLDEKFYLGVVRSYIKSINCFISSFLKRLSSAFARGAVKSRRVLKLFYGAYKVYHFIDHLAKIYEKPLKKPDYYFTGYRAVLRMSFVRYITMFSMKIFILTNKVFSNKVSRIRNYDSFFILWKKTYKSWLNIYYAKTKGAFRKKRKPFRLDSRVYLISRSLLRHLKKRNTEFWRNLYNFRADRRGYKRTLMNYLFRYTAGNYRVRNPFWYKRKKYRFKYNIFGKRIYLQKKRLFRRKSMKYIRWFRSLVTGGYYFSPAYAKKTFYRGGYGRRAWFSRRRAKHVFKMKFVFIRYFSKRFGLKNRTAFLRKAQHIARKGGNKWLRYYREFESRLLRVLVLFGLSSNDRMSKSLISNNSVIINRKAPNDYHHKTILRVKKGDMVSLANSALPFFLKKKIKFFKRRLNIYDRADQAKLVYTLFKKHFLEWLMPSVYSINGLFIKHGASALMSGPVVTNSKIYFSINRFIPFFNRVLFKIFVQRFSKKLN